MTDNIETKWYNLEMERFNGLTETYISRARELGQLIFEGKYNWEIYELGRKTQILSPMRYMVIYKKTRLAGTINKNGNLMRWDDCRLSKGIKNKIEQLQQMMLIASI